MKPGSRTMVVAWSLQAAFVSGATPSISWKTAPALETANRERNRMTHAYQGVGPPPADADIEITSRSCFPRTEYSDSAEQQIDSTPHHDVHQDEATEADEWPGITNPAIDEGRDRGLDDLSIGIVDRR